MFDHSPNTKLIYDFIEDKLIKKLCPIAVAKACSIVSAKLNFPRFNLFIVAPTRQFKSLTSIIVKSSFMSSNYIDLGSDFTINSIISIYGKKIHRKCLMINDATLLFSSKSKRTKDRLINGFAELISEGIYTYSDRPTGQHQLKGNISIIMNMTSESYERNKATMFESTFLERFLTLFYKVDIKEIEYLISSLDEIDLKLPEKIRPNFRLKINNLKEYTKQIIEYSKEFSTLSTKSILGTKDQVVALLKSHAILNNRNYICKDDLEFLDEIKWKMDGNRMKKVVSYE